MLREPPWLQCRSRHGGQRRKPHGGGVHRDFLHLSATIKMKSTTRATEFMNGNCEWWTQFDPVVDEDWYCLDVAFFVRVRHFDNRREVKAVGRSLGWAQTLRAVDAKLPRQMVLQRLTPQRGQYTWITRFPGRNLDPLEVVPPLWRESVCGPPTIIVHLLPTICVHPLHHVRRENAMSASPRDGGSI